MQDTENESQKDFLELQTASRAGAGQRSPRRRHRLTEVELGMSIPSQLDFHWLGTLKASGRHL